MTKRESKRKNTSRDDRTQVETTERESKRQTRVETTKREWKRQNASRKDKMRVKTTKGESK